ncbi:serine protease [Gallibacterium anatis]|uniref:S1 family peptidase n=1 Tax=Gallibacterium anatis TaxID=750 RepID=UPI0038B2F36D
MNKIALGLLAFSYSALAAVPALYDGMAKIRGCSAAVVQFEGQSDSDKVLLLTNGYCVSRELDAANAIVDRAYSDIATVYRGNTPLIVGSLPIDRIVYATMTQTDLAILRTGISYAELKDKLRIQPRQIAQQLPSAGDAVHVVSGNLEQHYQCQIAAQVNAVKEDKWQWQPAFRLTPSDSCQIKAGASGSPVINSDGSIVAVINTGNQDGESCTLNNSSEVDGQGQISVKKGAIYAVDSHMLGVCLQGGVLNLEEPCLQTKPQIHFFHTLPLPDGERPVPGESE